ncbi:hypothetical protein [Streptomyces sp. DH12]|uniref:hypothetical protein n=1 Tax=Streptomyces sp. DH12 TaxID=2857010 RepID=UPI001E5B908A|nr:hypothetical protein [Streptomyces sp. DH12]
MAAFEATPRTRVDAEAPVVEAPLARLRAAGVRCLPGGDQGGYYVSIPLADGTSIVFAGTAAAPETAYPDVSTRHPVRAHGGWTAQWEQGDGGRHGVDDIYVSPGAGLSYEEDTAALVQAIVRRVRRSGGSAPEGGPGARAEQLARAALAEWGITAQLDECAGDTWLAIGNGTDVDDSGMPRGPHLLLTICTAEDEWTVTRPPVRPGDEWKLMYVARNGRERELMTRPVARLDECVEAIAEWATSPLPTAGDVLLAELAKRGITAYPDGMGTSYMIPLDPASAGWGFFEGAQLTVADCHSSVELPPALHTGWMVWQHDEDGEPVGGARHLAGGDGRQLVDCTADSAKLAAFAADWLAARR